MYGKVTLVLGGARSGKSSHAERLLAGHSPRSYIATAQAGDEEMAARIAHHRDRRGTGWHTVEAPLELPDAIMREADAGNHMLVDCVTLWLSNLMLDKRDTAHALSGLTRALATVSTRIVLVSNEVGMGIVPENALARSFRDLAGLANQEIAAAAHEVIFVAAGLPLTLKSG